MRYLRHVWMGLCVGALGCGSSPSENGNAAGSSGVSASGASASGGAVGSGGAVASGGSTTASGGRTSSGGTGTGGSSATGGKPGSAGNAGGPPVEVQPCDALAADGVWEHIGPPEAFSVDIGSVNAAVDPLHPGVVYAGIERGLYKSTNCGADWVKISTGTNSGVLNSGYQWAIRIDPTNSDVYVTSGYGGWGLYKSTNGGVDWEVITPTGIPSVPPVYVFFMDPTDHQHVILNFHSGCGAPYSGLCFAETLDSGSTWRWVKGPAGLGGFSEMSGLVLVGGGEWLYSDSGIWRTTDSGSTWSKTSNASPCFPELTKVDGKSYYACYQDAAIQTSSDGKNWSRLQNSPQATALRATGKYLYAAFQNDYGGHPIHRAPLSDLAQWSTVNTPTIKQGPSPGGMPYDSTHKVLYVAAWSAGLWRVVTE